LYKGISKTLVRDSLVVVGERDLGADCHRQHVRDELLVDLIHHRLGRDRRGRHARGDRLDEHHRLAHRRAALIHHAPADLRAARRGGEQYARQQHDRRWQNGAAAPLRTRAHPSRQYLKR
jgi:hypothetical protein